VEPVQKLASFNKKSQNFTMNGNSLIFVVSPKATLSDILELQAHGLTKELKKLHP